MAAFLAAGAFSAPAFAADHYVSGNVGMSWFGDSTVESPLADTELGKYKFDSGLTVLGAVGCDYGSYRLEAEAGYQQNDLDSIVSSVDGTETTAAAAGDASVLSLMANGYYDIDLGGVDLYATAGVGVAQVNLDDVRDEGDAEDTGVTLHENTLAYQLGAGLAIPIGSNVMLDARYRYFATTDFTMLNGNTSICSNNALLGLRIGF